MSEAPKTELKAVIKSKSPEISEHNFKKINNLNAKLRAFDEKLENFHKKLMEFEGNLKSIIEEERKRLRKVDEEINSIKENWERCLKLKNKKN